MLDVPVRLVSKRSPMYMASCAKFTDSSINMPINYLHITSLNRLSISTLKQVS